MKNIIAEELIGQEFDWFAIDNNGEFGIFSTAGSGYIPEKILTDYISHNSISESFNLPNIGSNEVWNDFANYGLYVYDWKLHNGPYIKMANARTKISENMKNRLLNLKSLIKLNLTFKNETEINME